MDPANDALLAIMAVDPGTVSGVACAAIERPRRVAGVITPRSVWAALSAAEIESYEVSGLPGVQGWEIMTNLREWRSPYRYNAMVFEEFVLQPGHGSDSRSLLDPVRVISACDALAYMDGQMRWAQFSFQLPSAKGFATNDRLRRHGLWVRGSEHRRDAVRHICAYYGDLITKLNKAKR
jgi:hypothetical protein